MKIEDITLDDVRSGKRWRFVPPASEGWSSLPLETWGPLQDTRDFGPEDYVVYSGLLTYRGGEVRALLLIKVVGDLDYGGDYCERVAGKWRQLGLVPNPDSQVEQELIAAPPTRTRRSMLRTTTIASGIGTGFAPISHA
jgi:hypothetical protein